MSTTLDRSVRTGGGTRNRRLSFEARDIETPQLAKSALEAGDEMTPIPVHPQKGSELLLGASELVSNRIWLCLKTTLGTSYCEAAAERRFKNIALDSPENGVPPGGQQGCQIYIPVTERLALSRSLVELLDEYVQQMGLSDSDSGQIREGLLRSFSAVRSSCLLLTLYQCFWLEPAVVVEDSDLISGAIPHSRKWGLLRWATTADTFLDPSAEYEEALNLIVSAEKWMVTMAQINKPFVVTHKRSERVCEAITKLFLLGYWNPSMNLLHRCYFYPDDAFDEFVTILSHYFPPKHYCWDDPDDPRHPMRFPSILAALRRKIRLTFVNSYKISKDHLLRNILSVLADFSHDESSNRSDILNADVASDIDSTSDALASINEIFGQENGKHFAIQFATELFWTGHMLEDLMEYVDISLKDQNAVGLIFQKWWHLRKLAHLEFEPSEIAFALCLGNNVDRLIGHLTTYGDYFLPFWNLLIGLLAFYDFPVNLTLLRDVYCPAAVQFNDLLQKRTQLASISGDDIVTQVVRPYVLYLQVLSQLPQTLDPDEKVIDLLAKMPLCTSITSHLLVDLGSRCLYRDALHRSRQVGEYLLASFLEIRSRETDASELLVHLAFSLFATAQEGIELWILRNTGKSVNESSEFPEITVRLIALVNMWAINSKKEEVTAYPRLLEKLKTLLDGSILPITLLDSMLGSIVHCGGRFNSPEQAASLIVLTLSFIEQLSIRQRDVGTIDLQKYWNYVWELAKTPGLVICEEFASSYCERFTTTRSLPAENLATQLRVLRLLRFLPKDVSAAALPLAARRPLSIRADS